MISKVYAVILAAGKSTRMKTRKSKLLLEIKGKPVIKYVADACKKSGIERIIIVVGFNAPEIKNVLGNRFEYAYQKEQLGTAHALLQVEKQLLHNYNGNIIVLPADAPFITPMIIKRIVQYHRKTGSSATLLTTVFDQPQPYGRVIRNTQGQVMKIVEEKDASDEEKSVKEVSTSHYCFKTDKVLPLLCKIKNNNAKGEYYLTDIVELLYKRGYKIMTVPVKTSLALLGVNTRTDLQKARRFGNRL